MANTKDDWYFTKDQLENSPSRLCGIEAYKELSYRQQAANFIQDMGQKLKVSLLCINTAIVYMHRFYVFHSLTNFHWQSIAAAALFLAAKVEEQPRKLEHVIKAVNSCKRLDDSVDPERFKFWSQELAYNENILLQTLGFEVAIDHPHTHVVRCCHLVRASKDLAQTSYIIASNSLHLTTMCLQYKPTVVACFCIHFVCKWANWEIPLSNEKKQWYTYVDQSVTSELLEQLANEFLVIYEQCPSRLKEKIMAISGEVGVQLPYNNSGHAPSLPLSFEADKRSHGEIRTGTFRPPHEPGSSGQHRDKKDRVSHHNSLQPKSHSSGSKHEPSGHHHGHVPSVDPKFSKHLRISSMGHITNTKAEPKDVLRDSSSRDSSLSDTKSGSSSSNKDVSSSREASQQIRSSDKREYSQQRQEIKPSNSLSATGANLSVDPTRSRPVDPNRSRPVDPKLQTRRREEPTKPYPNKLESDIKKHLSAVVHDKNSLLQKPVNNSTSHRNKYLESSKSIPNQVVVKSEHQQQYNGASSNGSGSASSTAGNATSGSNGGIYGLPIVDDEPTPVKSQALVHPNHHHPQTPVQQNQIVAPVVPTRKPGLFSPDQTPPKKSRSKSPSNFGKKIVETNSLHQNNVEQQQRQQQQLQQEHITNSKLNRRRTSSTNSEPELRPVMKKIDEMQGFENIMRDSSIGLKGHNKVSEIVAPVVTENLVTKEFKPPDFKLFNSNTNTSVINGIETDPTIISSLLKETPSVSTHLPRTSSTTSISSTPSITIKVESEVKKKDSSHKEHKKNKKEKHKHKDKEKSREEKEKKKKHKEKDREKHKHKHSKQETSNDVPTQPIKLTIPRDKIQFPNDVPSSVKPELKLKIPRDKIKIENISETPLNPPATNSGLKIKIPRDAYTNVNNKRDRDKNSTTNEEPPSKAYKSSYNRYGDAKNVRNSYDKVRSYNKSNQPTPPSYNFVKNINFRYPPPPLHPQPPPPLPPPYFHPYQSNQLNTAPSNHYYFNYQQQVPMQIVPYSYYPADYQMYQNMYQQQYPGGAPMPVDQSLLWDQDAKPPLPPSSPITTVEMDVVTDYRPPLPLEPPPPSPQTEPPQTFNTEIKIKDEPKPEIKEEPHEPSYPSSYGTFTPPLPPKSNAS